MSWQNRVALDLILAEKGGVRQMSSDPCGTFIPNNTALDGSESRDIAGLESLGNQWTKHSGVAHRSFDNLPNFGVWRLCVFASSLSTFFNSLVVLSNALDFFKSGLFDQNKRLVAQKRSENIFLT